MKHCLTIILFLFSISSFAQTVVDRLVLKDGSVLEGYILRQENSGITFKSFCASIYVDLCDMSYIEDPDMSSDSIVIADVTIKDVSKNEFAKQLVGTKEIQIQELNSSIGNLSEVLSNEKTVFNIVIRIYVIGLYRKSFSKGGFFLDLANG